MSQPNGFHNWTARISCDNAEMPSGFAVHIFLKTPPENPLDWIGADGYVDSYYATASHSAPGLISEGFVHLNKAITKYSGLPTYDAQNVVPYLTRNLQWRVQHSDLMRPIPVSDLPSLEVAVFCSWSTEGGNPTQGDAKYHPSITQGKQGGCCRD